MSTPLSPLSALSPLDGRYHKQLEPLRGCFSEAALFRHRIAVEIRWLLALAAEPAIVEIEPFTKATNAELERIIGSFSEEDAARVKAIEAETNHDVKAIEYWLKQRLGGNPEAARVAEFVHFACTSEDINNLAYALMLKEARERVLLPALDRVSEELAKLARALAAFLFDDDGAMVRIDMSEYMEKYSVSRLVGAPPGYVGYEEGGQLTEAVRRRPYQVILLDEIEKAHPDVFNVLLQVLEDGRLTDGQGRTVDFRNAVVILTSNVGSQWIQEMAGQPEEAIRTRVLDELRQVFRPEFLNRLDETILFHSLGKKALSKIVDIMVRELNERLADRRIAVSLTPEAKARLAEIGYVPAFGARPLRRAIQKEIQDPLAIRILQGEFREGDRVTVDAVSPSGFAFRREG